MRPGGSIKPDDGGTGDGLAGAGLANHAEDFAARNGKRDIVNRDERASTRREFDAKVFDRQQRIVVERRRSGGPRSAIHCRSRGLRSVPAISRQSPYNRR